MQGTRALSAPLRVHWNLAREEDGGLSASRALELARELAELRVFFVTLGVPDGGRQDAGALISAMIEGGVRVTVSVSGPGSLPSADDLAAADVLALVPAGVDALKAMLAEAAPGGPGTQRPPDVSVWVVPRKDRLDDIIDIFSLAAASGVRYMGLPNPDLVLNPDNVREFTLDNDDRKILKRGLEALLVPLGDKIRVSVHDLFLHRELALPGLSARVEYAGCQAGDALVYIGETGIVYPCASLPVALGDLAGNTFREIWSSQARTDERGRILRLPEECSACPDAPACKGGCRGLALCTVGGYGKDPGCPSS